MLEIKAIILAAGEGKRMFSSSPKVLHSVCGRPMVDYPIHVAGQLGSKEILVVVSKSNPLTVQYLKSKPELKIVYQPSPLGTGHAVASCISTLRGFAGFILILSGDGPLIRKETLKGFLQTVQEKNATLGFMTTVLNEPKGYGRIVRNGNGQVLKIVEEKEAAEEVKKIREINTGIYLVQSSWLSDSLQRLKPHLPTHEYYLTDIVEMAIKEGQKVFGFEAKNSEEFLGINTRKQLSQAEEVMRDRLVEDWMAKGVTFVDPRHVYLDSTIQIGRDSVIHPQVYLKGKTRIGKNCVIECGAYLKDMVVGEGVHVKPYCVLEESVLEKEAVIGPFARIRPGSRVGRGAKVGNFVELKKAKLGPGVKANHLSYLGDVTVGAETNIGCGTITCNYDGVKKHPTKIGKKVFVGSDVQFVAPVNIGDGSYIGAGSTITENVPPNALAVARGRQVVKRGWGRGREKRKEKNDNLKLKT